MKWTTLLAAPVLAVCACDSHRSTRTTETITAPSGDTALREIVRRNAEAQEMAQRFGIDEPLEPSGRGGGPPDAAKEYEWPYQARTRLIEARCRALAQCAQVGFDLCVEREAQRLAAWPGEGCRPANVRACIESVRAGGCGDWRLPRSCSATTVCEEPIDVAR